MSPGSAGYDIVHRGHEPPVTPHVRERGDVERGGQLQAPVPLAVSNSPPPGHPPPAFQLLRVEVFRLPCCKLQMSGTAAVPRIVDGVNAHPPGPVRAVDDPHQRALRAVARRGDERQGPHRRLGRAGKLDPQRIGSRRARAEPPHFDVVGPGLHVCSYPEVEAAAAVVILGDPSRSSEQRPVGIDASGGKRPELACSRYIEAEVVLVPAFLEHPRGGRRERHVRCRARRVAVIVARWRRRWRGR